MTRQDTLEFQSNSQFEIIDITALVAKIVAKSGIKAGVASVFAPHTTAAIRINHNEPLLKQDIMKMLYRTVPIDINYAHDFFEVRRQVEANERSNGHAHVKAFVLGASETIPVAGGKLSLGDRQSVFLVELDGARKRRVIVTVHGD